MITVCLLRNYSFPDLKRQSPGGKGEWNNVRFVFEPVKECDYLVVFNRPEQNVNIRVKKGGAWLFVQEPPYASNNYLLRYFKYFDKIFSGFPDSLRNNYNQQALLPWHLDRSFDEIINTDILSLKKENKVNWITSTVNKHPGHAPRLKLISFLQKNHPEINLYGRGILPVESKWEVLKNAKYSIAVENYSGPGYWTEKLTDPILAGCIPFYHGCTDLEKYLPVNSYVKINADDPAGSVKIIQQTLESDFWQKNLVALKEAQQKLLYHYQLFPFIEQLISAHREQFPGNQTRNFIMDAYPMNYWEKIKNRLKK